MSRNTHFMNGSRTGSQMTIRQNQNNTLTLSKNSQSVTAKHTTNAQHTQQTQPAIDGPMLAQGNWKI